MDSTLAKNINRSSFVLRPLVVVGLLFVFLMGVRGLGGGFRLLGEDLIQSFFAATANPFVGLVVGLLATTLVQS
ncbi:MAG: Na/Pi cotransporter family protein, partial [Acidobacteriota bacterium]|nr:Na/Pi cotransporter family protein [Acidobacteriota bacterium]